MTTAPEKREEMRKRGLEELLRSQNGRAWLHDLLFMHCHMHSISHVPGCSDSTAYNEGARSVGTSLLQEVTAVHPQHYLKMLEENR
jgi:hypothetical protein